MFVYKSLINMQISAVVMHSGASSLGLNYIRLNLGVVDCSKCVICIYSYSSV